MGCEAGAGLMDAIERLKRDHDTFRSQLEVLESMLRAEEKVRDPSIHATASLAPPLRSTSNPPSPC